MALAAKVKVMPPVYESYQTDMILKTASNALASYILLNLWIFNISSATGNRMESFLKVGRFPATVLPKPSSAITQSDDPQSGSNSNKKRNLTSARNVVDAIAPALLTF